MKDYAIVCQNVSVHTKRKPILNGVTCRVPAGSLTGLLGPNGAGKSTLFRLISGLMKPDSGNIRIFGQPAGPDRLIQMAMQPDRGSLPGWLTAEEWLEMAEGLYPDWDSRMSRELQDSLEVDRMARIGSMSRGEEARLQLLTCLSRRAPLVILDEPFTGVDLLSRERIAAAVISALADGSRTFLIATHDIREMEHLFDRLILIDEGKVVGEEDVETLRQNGRSVEGYYREVFAR